MLEIVIPLFKVNWITKAVLESLNLHYSPRKIHIISVKKEIETIEKLDLDLPVECHNEDNFFLEKVFFQKCQLIVFYFLDTFSFQAVSYCHGND